MGPASVSVVIPTYNSSQYLPEALESVLAQTVLPLEIIVVDDGSTDDTADRLHPYLKLITYRFQTNSGVSAARNAGLQFAKGDYVAFLDADDVWHPRKLESQMRILTSHPDLGLLGTGKFDWPEAALPIVEAGLEDTITYVTWRQLVVKNYFTTSSVVARRDLLEQAGEFDCKMQGPEDRDLWLRLAELAPVANLNIPLVGYRAVPGSVSRQCIRVHESMLRLLRKLDERNAWRSDHFLRKRAYSYVFYTSALNLKEAGRPTDALGMVMRSLASYPWPFHRGEVRTSFARPKSLLVCLLQLVGLKRSSFN